MTTYTVTDELVVEAEDHADALRIAHAIWARGEHAELVRHQSRSTIEPVVTTITTVTS